MDENEKKTRRVQETFRKRQEAELLKCIWSSRMRHFRDSVTGENKLKLVQSLTGNTTSKMPTLANLK